ncbi:MAG TPA: ABC transporter permease [Anaeromyxobacteraceae bacterium]|nr:ABC transporter permease [Anaeromyxobacteraceae bacterium]
MARALRRLPASSLVRRALRTRRTRGALAAGGVAVSVVLVLVISATYRSVEVAVRAYAGQEGVGLWVAPRGTDNLVRSASLLGEEVREDIAALPGVRAADPVLRSFVTAEPLGGAAQRRRPIMLLAIGYRAPDGLGGAPRLATGRRPAAAREIVLDRAAAHRLGVRVGGSVLVNGSELEVVGLSARTNLVSTQLAFLDAGTAASLSGYGRSASFVAVGLSPGASAVEVALRIASEFPGVSIHPRAAFTDRNVEEIFAGFRPVQVLVSAIGFTAAAALIALLVQATLEDRRREAAVLLALGAPAGHVALAVVCAALRVVAAGVAVGSAGALVLTAALERWVPTLEMAPDLADLARVAILFVAVGLTAALAPVIRLGQLAPVEAFRP